MEINGIIKDVPHAPKRPIILNADERIQAISNVLRYYPNNLHAELILEFNDELNKYGHIYCYRDKPKEYLKGSSIYDYKTKNLQAASIILMINNNLDPNVAQFPDELITYGGNGSVFSNWAQYNLTMKYLYEINENQTLVMYSGHPLGLFPSKPELPRMIITNGMVIPNYSKPEDYEKMYAMCVSQYGQMTAGSYCYIGPQGIVHGTMLTILNAARKYLNINDPKGLVYLSSGLGGMSGAQSKAAKICGCISIIAEFDFDVINKRYEQGWIDIIENNIDKCIEIVKQNKKIKGSISIGFHGNIVDLLEKFADLTENLIDLCSDQTSLHNPYMGGYYPVGLTFQQARLLMQENPSQFKIEVQSTLKRHVKAINKLTDNGSKFWDYGNAFLLEAGRADSDIWWDDTKSKYKYPSYVQDIMGDIFSLGFGPFRWVCTSNNPEDLVKTDKIAAEVFKELMENCNLISKKQYSDNLKWIQEAGNNNLVVGSQARILYSNCEGRVKLAQGFNNAIRDGIIGPVVISRDHHDVSGTDSPFRETSNIYDGSQFTADMAVHNVIGDAMRGATWVSLHNGGGVGWGQVINGGFGMLLTGSIKDNKKAELMLNWDVCNGITRRSWSGNNNALITIKDEVKRIDNLDVTIPYNVDKDLIKSLLTNYPQKNILLKPCKKILYNCKIATMVGDNYGFIDADSIGINHNGVINFLEKNLNHNLSFECIDLKGKLVTPSLIDCHTHIVYAGNRSNEWEKKLSGISYQEIAQKDGGIINTVNETRNASLDKLISDAELRIKNLIAEGVATIEIKSGYGLDFDTETKQLLAAKALGKKLNIDVFTTYLGAHAILENADNYIEKTVFPMIKSLKEQDLIDAVDVFCENIAFDYNQTKKIIDYASSLNINIKLHGDQLSDNNCGALAAQYKALSCDHCEYTNENSIKMMANNNVIAVLLPISNMFINEKKIPPVDLFRKYGVNIAIATNCNPGSSPCQSLLFTMNQACIRFGLTPNEAFYGVTRNAAKALGKYNLGTIEIGKYAKLASWNCESPTDIVYNIGANYLYKLFA